MRRIIKRDNSTILTQRLKYPTHARKIRGILEDEQEHYCAYTEEQISITTESHVEHFNPTIKNTTEDGYSNWFAVCGTWNYIKKDEQWDSLQPILNPTAQDLEKRVIYDMGDFIYEPGDKEAENLLYFLDLNNISLSKERRNYIEMLRELNKYINLEQFLKRHPLSIKFRRAIESEFGFRL